VEGIEEDLVYRYLERVLCQRRIGNRDGMPSPEKETPFYPEAATIERILKPPPTSKSNRTWH